MGLRLFEIFFDKPQKVYFPGETVSGRIKVIIDATKKIRGLEFCCKGEARTGWNRYESVTTTDNKSEEKCVSYSGSEEYFKIKYYLVGGKGQEIELPPGEHVYPFTCALPPVLPPSFEDGTGHIRYTVRATLDRPWKFDQNTEVAFSVIAPLDLNLIPHLKESATMSLEKYFCCLWCKSGPLNVTVTLPCSGYVPGQTINMECNIDNASNVAVESLVFTFKQVIRFHATLPSRDVEVKRRDIVSKSHIESVPAKENGQFTEQIIVPSLPPSNLTNCSLIDLDYELEVVVKVGGFHSNMSSKFPITIGTVPIQGVAGYAPTAPPDHSVSIDMTKQSHNGLDSNPEINIGWVPPPTEGAVSPYPDTPAGLPPPYSATSQGGYPAAQTVHQNQYPQHTKYEESQFHESSQQPDLNFKPVYPVFTFQPTPNS